MNLRREIRRTLVEQRFSDKQIETISNDLETRVDECRSSKDHMSFLRSLLSLKKFIENTLDGVPPRGMTFDR